MNFKKHKGLIISGALVLVLLAGSLVFLHSAWSRYNKAKTELQRLIRSQTQLKSRDPFPSRENVEAERENLADAATVAVMLNNMLRQGQVEPQKMEAAEFMPLLERTLGVLSEKFKTAEIKIPDGFLFGFERYAKDGVLPDDAHIARLVQQLRIMERLCDILVGAGISELQAIKRDEFETRVGDAALPPPSTGRTAARTTRTSQEPASRRDAPRLAAQELYPPPLRFSMAFRSREGTVFNVINRLASDPMFCVVTNVELSNERPSVPTPDLKSIAAAEGAVRSVVVIGREGVVAKIELDVYRFNQLWDKLENLTGISVLELEKRVNEQIELVSEEQIVVEPVLEEQAVGEQLLEEQIVVEPVSDDPAPDELVNDSGAEPVLTVEIEEQE